ncbi:hypothetical protein B9Z55_016840 [Caenorhabditis nigoni]|uniref:T20D4.11-like domain-containing protein n=1 Tax=Caenorhabditis nigoni TaxID=1611254 RepID=A0A2G5T7C5_9PELO|nr:hypothetical protein B9Z55_016840 [Caenorhabditis nigoni]
MLEYIVLFLFFPISFGEQKPDCESEHAVLTMLNCTATLLDLIDIAKAHPKDYESLKAYLESCEHFLTCDPSYKYNTKYEGDIKNHKEKCNKNMHILKEFRNCEVKLREASSTCYQDYNPFTGDEMILKMAKKEKESCGKFFGEEDCMIKEATERCGKVQGHRYQKELRIVAKALAICDDKEN